MYLYPQFLTFMEPLIYMLFTLSFPLSSTDWISLSAWLFSAVQGCLANRATLTLKCLGMWSAHISQSDVDGIVPYNKM